VIVIDASAIVAMLTDEEDGDALADRLETHTDRVVSPTSVFEAVMGVARKRQLALAEARILVMRFLDAAGVDIAAIGRTEGLAALDAVERFGKGRHPAKLNLGDCFSYACARSLGAPLLYKSDDFAQTDIPAA
jgi:ribonuclease VapC